MITAEAVDEDTETGLARCLAEQDAGWDGDDAAVPYWTAAYAVALGFTDRSRFTRMTTDQRRTRYALLARAGVTLRTAP